MYAYPIMACPCCLHLNSEPKGADTLLKSNEAYKLIFREYPDVVSVEQMCEMLGGISAKTAYRLLRQNQIKHFKIGRTYKIPKLHIFEYLAVAQESDA
jgi:excisionase family DNA binding protein